MDNVRAPSAIHELIAAQAVDRPQALALRFGDTSITYAELEVRANRLAHAMRAGGVGPDARVAISIARSPEMAIAMLAVLKAGGAYVPLDPTYPADRLRYMLEDARPVLVVTQGSLEAALPTAGIPVIRVDGDRDAIAAHSATAPRVDLAAENLAYVIYTSGSTGRPKGTLLQHGGLANLVANQIRLLGLGATSRVVQFASLSFDASVWETFATLVAGGTLVLATADELLAGKELTATLRRHAVTHATLPPSVLAVLRDTELPDLATVVSAGEACSTALVDRWGKGRRFINAYGPTESTVCATYAVVAPGDRITIGRALDGITTYVLDEHGLQVRTGMTGELFLGGAGLARGYHARPGLTAERFTPDPFSGTPGTRMYRTGDHVRLLDNGVLEFVGRVDDQVKIRGFRIELGEIESALQSQPNVRHAVAAARGASPEDMRLVGYVVPAAPPLDTSVLLASLERVLPGHMVPSALVVLDAFPMTPAGKVDRQALPAPGGGVDHGVADDSLAARLAAVFAEVLDVPRVGIDDNFFELGGHSILAASLVTRIEEVLGREVALRDVFDAPTPAELARLLTPPADEPPPSRLDVVAQTIAGLFAQLLELPSAGVDDNFFELGGHSILAAHLVATIEEAFHVELSLRDVFDGPSPRELAAIVLRDAPPEPRLEESSPATGLAEPALEDIDGPSIPLSYAQQRMWFLQQLAPDDTAYVMPFARRLRGQLDVEVLRRAIETVVHTQATLRTRYPSDQGIPRQAVTRPRPQRLPVLDVGQAADPDVALARAIEDIIDRPFDLAAAPPLRMQLVRLSPADHVLVLAVHHIAADAQSLGVFWRDVAAAYAEIARGVTPASRVPRMSYAEYATAQRERLTGATLDRQLAYWTTQLAGAPSRTELPYRSDGPRASTAAPREVAVDLGRDATAAFRELVRRTKSSAFIAGLAAVRAVLARITGQDDLCIGTPVSNRDRIELDGVIGVFLNTVVFRTATDGHAGFAELVRRERDTVLDAFTRKETPFEMVVQALGIERDARTNPLFQVSYAHQAAADVEGGIAQVSDSEYAIERHAGQFDLEIDTFDRGDSIEVHVSYKPDLFEDVVIAKIADHIACFLRAAVREPTLPAARVPIVDAAERARLIQHGNPAEEPIADISLGARFEAQVDRTPDAVAVMLGDDRLTYRQLDERANRIAHALHANGIGPEQVVGIALERSLDQVASILAVAKAGGAWVPLDPSLPAARLTYMAELARPRAVITTVDIAHTLPSFGAPLIDVVSSAVTGQPGARVRTPPLSGTSLAYILFTSGSTGKPKGVMVEHLGANNELSASSRELRPIGAGDAMLALAPYTFDQSVHEMWWPLVHGATLVLIAEGEQREPARVVERMRHGRVTNLEIVPTMLRALIAEPGFATVPHLVQVVALGEALTLDLVRAFYAIRPDVQLVNDYGPTEASITVCAWHAPRDAGTVVIGKAWVNVQFHVLDAHGEPVPTGVAGELYIGGLQVARGYACRPDLTAERFVPDPFASAPGGRMYRTGDRVRRVADGAIEFLGRVDEQVKLRGFRIELGEIEASLLEHPAVAAAAVVVVPSARGDQLAAYVVMRTPAEPAALRAHLADKLPEYMVPAAYVALDALPVNPSGKLNRRALPAPTESAFEREPGIAPRTDHERTIAAVWCEVLALTDVGVRDDFFARGGHSLLATQVIARLRERLGVALALKHLFDAPTIEGLATIVESLAGAAAPAPTPPVPVPQRAESLELSYAQQRLWLVDQMMPGSSAYHMPSGKRIYGEFDHEALRRAIETVVRRHEILRTVFPASGGLPQQLVLPPGPWELPIDDLSGLSDLERHNQLHRISRDDAEAPFDLAAGPLLRTRIVRLAPTDHVVLVTMHHIISDGWSIDLFYREVTTLYDGYRGGRDIALPPLPLQYADFAAEQRATLTADVVAGHLAYWTHHLAGAPAEVALPKRAPRTAATGRSDEVVVEVDADTTRAIRELGQREGASTFMILLAAFRAMLARTTGQDDIVIGTPIANRDRKNLEGMIGLFVNTLVLRNEVDRRATFAELVRRERETALAAYAHQDAPFEMIVDELGVERVAGRSPVFQIWFVQESVGEDTTRFAPDGAEAPFPRTLLGSKFDLSVYVNESRGRIEIALTFNADLLHRHDVDGIARRFVRALELATRTTDQSFTDLDLGAPPEAADPRIAIDKPAYPPVLEIVEQLAAADPSAPALRHGDVQWTRAELWRAAGGIASALALGGVGAGHRVGLTGPPSPGLIAAYLGVLRSGACLVPLSSRLSRENAERLLELVDARVVLQVAGGTSRATGRVPAATVEAATGAVTMPAALAIPSRPADPAIKYVYFTSGTTGAQKGVIGNLVALGHFSAWQRQMFGAAAGPISAQLTELGFDVFLRDTMFALTAGKVMALPPKDVSELEPSALVRWLHQEGVTAVHTVPSLARAWLRDAPDDVDLRELRVLFVVGEQLDAALVERWRARFRPDAEFINLYGTTETGPAKCWYRVPHPPAPGVQPIGWALPETQILIMRDARHLAAMGEVGEVVIRTPFSTLGYLDGTRGDGASFYQNPFRSDPTDILYRTGDLGRHRVDGAVDILGRADDQVKVRGQRIDPPGIAAALRAHPAVMDAAVIALKLSADDVRLVGYVVRSHPPPSTGELRELLRQTVPPYMIPTAFVFLDDLPRKPNGKLDREALPAPDWDAGDADAFTPPRSPEEETIATIWCEVLDVPRVSVRDDFFALGGHSLLAVLVTSRIRATLDVDVGIQRFFEAPTVEALATAVVRQRGRAADARDAPPITPIARGGELPLSFAQQRMWFLHRLAPTSPAYHVPLVRRLRGPLAPDGLRRAFEEVVRRHEALRAVFPSRGGAPVQVILDPQRWDLPVDDISHLPTAEREPEAHRLSREEAARPFDLETGPVLRTRLVRIAPDDHLVLVTLHHVVSDAWSMGVFWTEVSHLYRAYTTGAPAQLPALPIQYADFAAWQRKWLTGSTLDAQLGYWLDRLADAPAETALPLKGPRPTVAGTRGGLVAVELGEDLVASIRSVGKKTGATRFVTLLAAFRAVLARTTGQDDLCIGTPIANRNRKELEPLIGVMLNTLVLRTPVDHCASFTELLRAERATALGAYAHQDAPFEMIVDALHIERSLNRTPLFQVSFVHQNTPQDALPIGDLADELYATKELSTRFDLSVISFERGGRIVIELIYNDDLFDRWQIEQVAGHFVSFLRDALRDPARPLAQIAALDSAERARLLVEWNRTGEAALASTIPQMFEAQVDRTPDATAVVLGTEQITYRELDDRANQIANALVTRGVGPEVVVGISLARSFELVAGILGVSKAGGAWVPLDPHLPAARIDYITSIAKPRVIVDAAFAADAARQPSSRPARPALDPDHLAYVLFTSGSTGRPKGVMIAHRGIANELISAQTLRSQLDSSDAFLQLAPYTFDLSVHEMLWPLTTGARLVLMPEGDHRDPRRIVEEMRDRHVTIMHPVPTVLRALLADERFDRCKDLRVICSGGEAMPLDVLRTFTTRRPDVRLINSYGPTETSVTVSQWRARPDASAVAIGTPWLGTQMYVLDARLEPVPLGVAGELYIGGVQVGRGYAAQPGLTAERFIPDPFAVDPGQRMYRTGDRAKRWRDGNVEILGRVDSQVKVRGFRIELGEIEAVIRQAPGVREVAVVVDGTGADARLVAYVVADAWDANALHSFVVSRVPEYMVPKVLMRLDAMPLTRSGKIDRGALPAPELPSADPDAFEAPATPIEEVLAAIWTSLLDVEQVGRNDDFFDLGGHSLLAARLAWESKVSISTIFSSPTIAGLAQSIVGAAGDPTAFWTDRLDDAPAEGPLARTGPASSGARRCGRVTLALGADIVDRLRARDRELGTTPLVTIAAGLRALFYRHSAQDDVLLAVASDGRDPVVLRQRISGSISFGELVSRERALLLEAFAHGPPQAGRSAAHVRLQLASDARRSPLSAKPVALNTDVDLDISVEVLGDAIELDLVYDAEAFGHGTIAGLVRAFSDLLAAVALDPDASLDDLAIGTAVPAIETPPVVDMVVRLEPRGVTSAPVVSQQAGHYDVFRDDPTNQFNHMGLGFELAGPLDVRAIKQALDELRRRHSVLRHTYREIDGYPHQFVTPMDVAGSFALESVDLTALSGVERDAKLDAFLLELRARAYDLARGPIIRGGLAVLAPDRHVLALYPHHLSCDGASMAPLVADLKALYRHFAGGEPLPPEPVLQYIDFADYFARFSASPAGQEHRAFWERRLAGATPIALPADGDRAAVERARDAAPRGMACFPTVSITETIPADVSRRLDEIARKLGCSKMMVLIAGYAATLSRITGQTDFCIQTPFSLRHDRALERTIGLLVNAVLVRVDASGSPAFGTLAQRVAEAALSAFEHGNVPVTYWAPHQLRRLNFNFVPYAQQGAMDTAVFGSDLRSTQVSLPSSPVKAPFDLHLWVIEDEDDISLRMLVNTMLFRPERAQEVLRQYVALLAEVSRDPSVIL